MKLLYRNIVCNICIIYIYIYTYIYILSLIDEYVSNVDICIILIKR